MLVLTAVSSINTSRAGSSRPCSRIQRRRARATSARCRSAAFRLFLKVISPERAAAGTNAPLAQHCNDLYQSQVGVFGNHSQYLLRELFQRRNASSTRFRGGASTLVPALQPLYRRTHAHVEKFGGLSPRRPHLHCCDNALSQFIRTGLRHPPPPAKTNQCTKTRSSAILWESPDSDRSGTALAYVKCTFVSAPQLQSDASAEIKCVTTGGLGPI
jgi:hypothetical protein